MLCPYGGNGSVRSPHGYCRSEAAGGLGSRSVVRTGVLRWAAVLLSLLAPAVVSGATTFQFRVEASTADVVLKQIAQQSDTQILFPLDQVRSIRANGLIGEYPVARALEIALAGTGLRASLRDSGVIVVSLDQNHDSTKGRQNMRRGIWGALIGAFSWLTAASAQDQQQSVESVETIVVTGSLIKRERDDSSQLVTSIDSEELLRRGSTNAVDILAAVSQHQPIATSSDGARSGGLTNLANLRTLGPENTLVLVNGKRVVNNPIFDNGVDLNTVPTSLLETVDVLSDGASSIYGSDAVAGVINFRTRTDFEGLQYTARVLEPEQPGGSLRSASLGGGIGSLSEDRWNVVAGVTWRDREAINARDRPFPDYSVIPNPRGGNTVLAVQPFPANAIQGGVVRNPYPCDAPNLAPLSTGGCGLVADRAGLLDLANEETQKSAFGRATTQIGNQRLAVEYLWAESSVISAITGTDIFNFTMPNTNPYYPGLGLVPAIPGFNVAQPITITSRFTPGGRRTTEALSETDRLLAQFEGELAGVNFEVWALRSESTTRLKSLDGALLRAGVIDGLAGTNGAPFINPFGPQSPAAAAYLERIKVRDTLTRGAGMLKMAGLTLSKSLFNLPAGPLSAALAYEYGDEEMSYTVAPINALLLGAVPGNGVQAAGDRTRSSVTAELLVPITGRLEASLSARSDEYSDFGGTVNPKLMLTYDVVSALTVHASYNKGFRAPPLPKLFAPQSLGIVGGFRNDPFLCPGGVVDVAAGGIAARDCGVAFRGLNGGNQDLQPQRSDAFTVGFDLRLDSLPLGYASLGADYWSYEMRSAIGTVSPDAVFANPAQFSSYIIRCSQANPVFVPNLTTCTFPGGTGDAIAYIALTNANVGTTRTSGVDLDASWIVDGRFGTFSLNYRGTYLTEYEFQRAPGDPFLSRKGRYVDGSPAIDYSHYLTLGWEHGDWNVGVQNRWRAGYDDCNVVCGVPASLANEVDAYSLWNLTTTYKLNDALSLTLYAENVLDEDPPFTNGNNSNCAGCDLRFVDVTGRAFGITLTGRIGRGDE